MARAVIARKAMDLLPLREDRGPDSFMRGNRLRHRSSERRRTSERMPWIMVILGWSGP
jgi:hypothetical protein